MIWQLRKWIEFSAHLRLPPVSFLKGSDVWVPPKRNHHLQISHVPLVDCLDCSMGAESDIIDSVSAPELFDSETELAAMTMKSQSGMEEIPTGIKSCCPQMYFCCFL